MSDRSVLNPHNDALLTAVQPETAAEPKHARWPLLMIILGLIATLIWTGFLVWVAGHLLRGLFS
jgi:hypothetical protein